MEPNGKSEIALGIFSRRGWREGYVGMSENEPDESADDLRRSYMLRRFWQSGRQFWSGADKRTAWFLTGALLATIVVQVVIQYQLTVWNRAIFDGLEKRDAAVVGFQAMIFPLLAVASVSSWVMLVYLRMTAQRRWRRWLSGHVIDRWLANGRYYQLNLVKGDHGTPEYRIAEDLRVATESPVEFVVGIVSAALSAATFIVVLWTIGGSLDLQLGGTTITIPAFLVIGAIVYAIIASGSMLLIGSRFVRVAETKNQAEAEYRYALTRVRENGESIALIGGEPEERAGLDASLRNVLRRWRAVCFQTMRTTIVYQGSGIIGKMRGPIRQRPRKIAGRELLVRPAGALQRTPRPLRVQIGDGQHVQARGQTRLRQEHRAKLAATDHADAHRPTGFRTLRQQTVEIHAHLQSTGDRARQRRSLSTTGTIRKRRPKASPTE